MDIMTRFRDLSKLPEDELPYDDAYIEDNAFPVVEKMLYKLLDTEYTITETIEGEDSTFSTGDDYIDEVAAHLVCWFAYETVDWGSTIDGKPAADKFNQSAMRLVSYVYPGKVVYNPYHNRYYPKDDKRGVAYQSVEYDNGSDDY